MYTHTNKDNYVNMYFLLSYNWFNLAQQYDLEISVFHYTEELIILKFYIVFHYFNEL